MMVMMMMMAIIKRLNIYGFSIRRTICYCYPFNQAQQKLESSRQREHMAVKQIDSEFQSH